MVRTKRQAGMGLAVCVAAALAGRAFGQAEGAGWKATSDGLAGTLATQPSAGGAGTPSAAAVAGDLGRGKTGLTLSAGSPFMSDLYLPNRPSKFGLVSSMSQGYEVWNFKTGTKEKTSTARLSMREMILSPDAVFIVGTHFGTGDAGMDIFSTRTDKVVGHVTPKAGQTMRPLGFVGTDRVALYLSGGGAAAIRMYGTANAAAGAEIVLPGEMGGVPGFSANGKLIAVATEKGVTLVDAVAGKVLGSVALPAAERPGMPGSGWALAFSPDGKELAALQVVRGAGNKVHGVFIAVETGQVTADLTGDLPMGSMAGVGASVPRLDWSPEGSRLSLGGLVLERKDLALAGDYAGPGQLGTTRWADEKTLISISRQGGGFKTSDQAVGEAKAVAGGAGRGMAANPNPVTPPTPPAPPTPGGAARGRAGPAGGTASAPASTVPGADAAEVKTVVLTGNGAGGWGYKPADLPKAKAVAALINVKPVTTGAPATETVSESQRVTGIFFTSRETHAAVIEHATVSAFQPGHLHTWLERYDLATGTAGAGLELSGDHEMLDVSASGNVLVMRTGAGRDGLAIYGLDKGAYKVTGEFAPFAAGGGETRMGEDAHGVAWAGMVDETHVLVESSGKMLALVELPGNKIVWQAQLATARDELRAGIVPALSPDRRVCAVCRPEGACLIDPLTGSVLQGLEGAGEKLPAGAVAFSPDGTRLAVLGSNRQKGEVEVFDLKTGASVMHAPVAQADSRFGFGLAFASADGVLFGVHLQRGVTQTLVSVSKGAAIWNYHTYDVRYGSVMPEERLVYVPYPAALAAAGAPAGTPAGRAAARGRAGAASSGPVRLLVASAALPHEEAVKAAAGIKADELYTWHPGMTVKLELTVVGDEEYRKQQAAAWTSGLKQLGFTVDDASANVLRANSFFLYGPPSQYDISGQQVTLNMPTVGYEMALTVGGKEVWKVSQNKAPDRPVGPPVLMVRVKEGESAQAAADREYPAAKNASTVIMPPQYVAAPRQLGRSILGQKGAEPVPQRGAMEIGAAPAGAVPGPGQ